METNIKIEDLKSEALTIPQQARALAVTNTETYQAAGALLVSIKGLRKKISDVFTPIKRAADAAKQAILAQERAADAPLLEAENILKPAMEKWDTEQERIRREEERRLQDLARKQEEERILAEAQAAEAQGDKKAVEEILAAPVVVAPVVLARSVPKVAGVSYREVWKFRILNPTVIPRQYLMPDEVKIGGVVRSLKGAASIPGVEVYAEKTVAGRA